MCVMWVVRMIMHVAGQVVHMIVVVFEDRERLGVSRPKKGDIGRIACNRFRCSFTTDVTVHADDTV